METNPEKKVRIIDSFWTFLVATVVVGPFALPLLWRNPRFKRSTKIIGSVVVIALTVGLLIFSKMVLTPMYDQVNELLEQSL
jgi:hypothetical protein